MCWVQGESQERGMFSVYLGSHSWWTWRWRQGQPNPASLSTVCQVPNAKGMGNFCLCSPALHWNNPITLALTRSESGSEHRPVWHTISTQGLNSLEYSRCFVLLLPEHLSQGSIWQQNSPWAFVPSPDSYKMRAAQPQIQATGEVVPPLKLHFVQLNAKRMN